MPRRAGLGAAVKPSFYLGGLSALCFHDVVSDLVNHLPWWITVVDTVFFLAFVGLAVHENKINPRGFA